MTELDTVSSGKVKFKGIFDFKELYRFLYTYLVDNGYFVVEKEYTEKNNQNGKEVVVKWDARRKISDYFRFYIKVNWRIIGMKDADVEKNGEKLTLNKGDNEVEIVSIIEKDYENKWDKNEFAKFLRGVYDRYIIRGRIDDYEGKIFTEANEFAAQVKAFVALEGRR